MLDAGTSTAGCTIVGYTVNNKRDVADAVVSSDALKDVFFECDSLHNIMHEKKAVASQVIPSVVVRCADDSWKLEYGDIVHVFDEYECEVRVRVMDEEGVWANGRWVRTDRHAACRIDWTIGAILKKVN